MGIPSFSFAWVGTADLPYYCLRAALLLLPWDLLLCGVPATFLLVSLGIPALPSPLHPSLAYNSLLQPCSLLLLDETANVAPCQGRAIAQITESGMRSFLAQTTLVSATPLSASRR